MIPVDVVPRVLAGSLVIGIWIGQSWPQQDYVTIVLLLNARRTHHGSPSCGNGNGNGSNIILSTSRPDLIYLDTYDYATKR